jgi:hypothetical protein
MKPPNKSARPTGKQDAQQKTDAGTIVFRRSEVKPLGRLVLLAEIIKEVSQLALQGRTRQNGCSYGSTKGAR